LKSWVTYRGKPLPDAKVVFEPEPYLGSDVLQAEGTTDTHGAAQLTIPAEYLPDKLRTKKLLRCGTYKVRITHRRSSFLPNTTPTRRSATKQCSQSIR